jgi:hypothetical protein
MAKSTGGVVPRKTGIDKNPGQPKPTKGKTYAPKGKPNC